MSQRLLLAAALHLIVSVVSTESEVNFLIVLSRPEVDNRQGTTNELARIRTRCSVTCSKECAKDVRCNVIAFDDSVEESQPNCRLLECRPWQSLCNRIIGDSPDIVILWKDEPERKKVVIPSSVVDMNMRQKREAIGPANTEINASDPSANSVTPEIKVPVENGPNTVQNTNDNGQKPSEESPNNQQMNETDKTQVLVDPHTETESESNLTNNAPSENNPGTKDLGENITTSKTPSENVATEVSNDKPDSPVQSTNNSSSQDQSETTTNIQPSSENSTASKGPIENPEAQSPTQNTTAPEAPDTSITDVKTEGVNNLISQGGGAPDSDIPSTNTSDPLVPGAQASAAVNSTESENNSTQDVSDIFQEALLSPIGVDQSQEGNGINETQDSNNLPTQAVTNTEANMTSSLPIETLSEAEVKTTTSTPPTSTNEKLVTEQMNETLPAGNSLSEVTTTTTTTVTTGTTFTTTTTATPSYTEQESETHAANDSYKTALATTSTKPVESTTSTTTTTATTTTLSDIRSDVTAGAQNSNTSSVDVVTESESNTTTDLSNNTVTTTGENSGDNENEAELIAEEELLADVLMGEAMAEADSLTTDNTNEVNGNDTLSQSAIVDNSTSHMMMVVLVSALSIGLFVFLVVIIIVGKRLAEGWRRRHYSRIDYLVNGMYN